MNQILQYVTRLTENAMLLALAVKSATDQTLGAPATMLRCSTEPGSPDARVVIAAAIDDSQAAGLGSTLDAVLKAHARRFGRSRHARPTPVDIALLTRPIGPGSSALFVTNWLMETFVGPEAWLPVDFLDVQVCASLIPGTSIIGERALIRCSLTPGNLRTMVDMARRAGRVFGQRAALFPMLNVLPEDHTPFNDQTNPRDPFGSDDHFSRAA